VVGGGTGAAIGSWVFRVPLALLFALVLEWGVVWEWYALLINNFARSTLPIWSFRCHKWSERLGHGSELAVTGRRGGASFR